MGLLGTARDRRADITMGSADLHGPSVTVLPLQIPKTVDFHLKTTSFSAFVPQLQEKYPDMEMKLKLSAPSAPDLSIGPGGVSLQPVVDVQAYAIPPNSTLAPLFLLSLTGNVSAVIDVKSGHIIGNLTVGRIKLSLKHSDVGDFEVASLEPTMNTFASSFLVPRINGENLLGGNRDAGVVPGQVTPSEHSQLDHSNPVAKPDRWMKPAASAGDGSKSPSRGVREPLGAVTRSQQ
ncbi:hypothetical protein llap_21279 [Limosa lapponica baueri]|uniref:Bactericidal permeability-increasing protein n=1 Tax=Limosa lapponica baueri TaxID=1758121 RepID=A0A2I0T3P0_LIMLA|nr:hypothetical protein llap_21279 [Limosa lapponica baueri]